MVRLEFIRRVYEDGKVTIPKELRNIMGLRVGDYVRLRVVETIPLEQPPRTEGEKVKE